MAKKLANPYQTQALNVTRLQNKIWTATFSIDDRESGSITTGEASIKFDLLSSTLSPKLKEILMALEARNSDWPWTKGLTTEGDFLVSWGRDQGSSVSGINVLTTPIIKSVELSLPAYQKALQLLKSTKNIVSDVDILKNTASAKLSGLNLIWEHLPGNQDWLVTGYATVKDGDTIDLKIVTRGSALVNDHAFDEDGTITIRYAGIDTAEIDKTKDGPTIQADALSRNQLIAQKYHIDIGLTWNLGADGKVANQNIMYIAGGYVIVDIDSSNNEALHDKYNRYIGMVYKSLYDNKITPDPMSVNDWYININKTMIGTASQYQWTDAKGRYQAIPLASVDSSFQFSINGTRFDTINWGTTYALDSQLRINDIDQSIADAQALAAKQVADEMAKIRSANSQTQRSIEQYIVTGGETINGILNEYKSRGVPVSLELLLAANDLKQDADGNYILPVGLTLNIPIIKIIEQTDGKEFTVSSGNVIDNTQDFFTPIDDRRDMTTKYHVRIGDVQLIIPPLSIDVNQVSSLEKIKTLRTKSSIITKSGSTHRTLTLQLYFHDLDTINGIQVHMSSQVPDYYMDGLRPLIAQFKKVPFVPIENEYINETLGIHEVCLVNLSVNTVPGFPHSLAATLILAEFDPEAYMPQIDFLQTHINFPLMRWYYQQAMQDTGSPYRTYLAPVADALTNDFKFTIASEDDLISRQAAIKDVRFLNSPIIFNDQVDQGKNLLGRMKHDADRAAIIKDQHQKYQDQKTRLGDDFPSSFTVNSKVGKAIYGEGFNISSATAFYIPSELITDLPWTVESFVIKIEAETNIADVPTDRKLRENIYRFDLWEANEKYLNKIIASGKNADLQVKNYKYNYDSLQQKADSSEGMLTMEDYYIDNMYITQMNVTYENSLSMVQTQTGQQPSYQYLGAQDPYIQVTMETMDANAITSLKDLIATSDEYSRKYRLGITSGFVGFENQLTRLFGVTTVMIENCTIRTVPAFPGRFQVNLTLCGFNKTQKRSETLDGIVGASSTEKKDRYVTNDPTQQDAIIIERKMKDLELYPDLELPTYEELNNALPNIGAGITLFHNPQGAKYIDPDFYISNNWTFRSYFKQYRDKNNNNDKLGLMQLKDFSGMRGSTQVDSTSYFTPDSDSFSNMQNIDARAKTSVIQNPQFLYPMGAYPINAGAFETPQIPVDTIGLKDWIADRNNIYAMPTLSQFKTWWVTLGSTVLSMSPELLLRLLRNPTPLEVYQEIYKWVDQLWVANAYAFDDRKSDSKKIKKITYSTIEDLSVASYLYLRNSGDGRFANAPLIEDGKVLSYADLNATKGLITRERMANYIKAMLDLESGWTQFKEQPDGSIIPNLNTTAPAVGIGQIMLSVHATSIEDAQRLSWDWRYNIEYAIRYLYKAFQKAWQSSDINVRSRPWDWAIRWYNLPAATILAKPTPGISFDNGQYWPAVMTRFQGPTNQTDQTNRKGAWYNAETSRYNTPGQPGNLDILYYLNDVPLLSQALVAGDRTAVIQAIKDYLNKGNLSTTSQRNSDADIDKKVQNMTTEEVIALYKKTLGFAYTVDGNDVTVAPLDKDNTSLINFQFFSHKEHIDDSLKTNLLLSTDTPDALWRDMFTDMVEYDQRGRLLRAFPTFQMFIVDEGRWMTNYKLWDNLYGFNSIQSIDIHKSRKIAADTAVIKMTNVYSNLTSRRIDEDYGDWTYNIWDNLILGNPSQQLLDERADVVSSMFLQTGTRIHLRMGYGSDATSLPVMFNGTITEMDTQDLVTIVAQGDGIELTNIISADPGETNDSGLFSRVVEPRDLLCKFMTSKGNWFRDVVNNVSGGILFKDNPLGIMHFGNPTKVPKPNTTLGAAFGWYVDGADFGEAVQNIYSSNGANTFSQWTFQDGSNIDGGSGYNWADLFALQWPKGDELNIELKLYGQTVWDVAHTLAYCSPDYIMAVHPFEMRSTLFFGKPYYKLAYRYDSVYQWQEDTNLWKRTVTSEFRKPYQQFHMFMSNSDIISNRVKASEEGVYTNVIAMYNGKPTPLQQADADIRFDKQKTKVVETSIINTSIPFLTFWTAEKQATYFAQSTLRDYIKDMYKGTLLVLGDPTVKPHDMCYIADTLHDMNGNFTVKDVTHSFSMDTGFITSISPDAVVVVDDVATISMGTWFNSTCIGAASYFLGKNMAARSLRKLTSATIFNKALNWSGDIAGRAMLKLANALPHDKNNANYNEFKDLLKQYSSTDNPEVQKTILTKMENSVTSISTELKGINADKNIEKLGNVSRKGLISLSKGIIGNLKEGKNALSLLRIGGLATSVTTAGISVLATMALTLLTQTLSEKYRRMKKSRQAVMIMPLQYQGRAFTAGLNGSAGAVVGTNPGKMDQFFMGMGYGGKNDWTKVAGQTLNFLFEGDGALGNVIDAAFGEDPTKGDTDYGLNSSEPNAMDNAWNDAESTSDSTVVKVQNTIQNLHF